ncbi:U-box domain-containing protein 26-like [Typha latifolia]|uniref:U-box domain-containing protein 26-like n=1 Tax=Typha latifolia TaxID=4733 RepID=UPI003C2ECF33
MSIPHLFRCPISLDLFTDPVTLSTGQTYDRPSIEKWLADGHLTCPVTMQRLRDTSLVPNHTLRHLIDQWIVAEPDIDSRRAASDSISGTEFSLATLKHSLQSKNTTNAAKFEILKKVRILSVESDIGRTYLIHLGFSQVLLRLLFENPVAYHLEMLELALDCGLSLLPSGQVDALNMLKEDKYLASFMLLLEQGHTKIKTSLCYLLEAIATSLATRELCEAIGQSQRVLRVLVSLMHSKCDVKASDAAVRAIAGISLRESNRGNVIREGGLNGLVTYLSSSIQMSTSRALATVEILLGLEAGRKAMAKDANVVQVLVKHVFIVPTDHEASEHAVGSLLIMCSDSARVQSAAVNAGLLPQLLLLLQSQCSSRAKIRVSALLKLLKSMW